MGYDRIANSQNETIGWLDRHDMGMGQHRVLDIFNREIGKIIIEKPKPEPPNPFKK